MLLIFSENVLHLSTMDFCTKVRIVSDYALLFPHSRQQRFKVCAGSYLEFWAETKRLPPRLSLLQDSSLRIPRHIEGPLAGDFNADQLRFIQRL